MSKHPKNTKKKEKQTPQEQALDQELQQYVAGKNPQNMKDVARTAIDYVLDNPEKAMEQVAAIPGVMDAIRAGHESAKAKNTNQPQILDSWGKPIQSQNQGNNGNGQGRNRNQGEMLMLSGTAIDQDTSSKSSEKPATRSLTLKADNSKIQPSKESLLTNIRYFITVYLIHFIGLITLVTITGSSFLLNLMLTPSFVVTLLIIEAIWYKQVHVKSINQND